MEKRRGRKKEWGKNGRKKRERKKRGGRKKGEEKKRKGKKETRRDEALALDVRDAVTPQHCKTQSANNKQHLNN